jgi:sulfatase maturation enzyme AslB (radical SAM superfamily)
LRDRLLNFNSSLVSKINDTKTEFMTEIKQTNKLLQQTTNEIEIISEIIKPKQLRDCQVNVYNFQTMQLQPSEEYEFIRFDPNNNCNLHCLYCHNPRSQEIIDTEEFSNFLEKKSLVQTISK